MRQLMTLTLMSARYAANMTSGRWQSDGKHHRKKKDLLNGEHTKTAQRRAESHCSSCMRSFKESLTMMRPWPSIKTPQG